MQEVRRAIHDKLHARPALLRALMTEHLSIVAASPPALDLLVRFLPSDAQLLGSFYQQVLDESDHQAGALLENSRLLEHIQRELRRLTHGLLRPTSWHAQHQSSTPPY